MEAYVENNPINGHFATFELGSEIGYMSFENIFINGKKMKVEDADKYVCQIVFDNIYKDGRSSSVGKINKIIINN